MIATKAGKETHVEPVIENGGYRFTVKVGKSNSAEAAKNGTMNARINSGKARQRADELEVRLQKRLEELEQERRLSPLPPVVMGGALIVPAGMLSRLKGEPETAQDTFAKETARVEKIAMDAIMELELQLGYEPRDVSAQKCG